MTAEGTPGTIWVERYEELRAQGSNGGQCGLALLLRHGLAGWMAAWRTFVGTQAGPATRRVPVPIVPPDLRSELAGTLASMALRSCQGGNA